MNSISYSRLRANLKSALDKVCDEREPIVVERKKGGDVVVLSREDYESLQETAYLLRSPANARRLLNAVKRKGRGGRTFRTVKAVRLASGL